MKTQQQIEEAVSKNIIKSIDKEIRKLVNTNNFKRESFFAQFTPQTRQLYSKYGEAYWESDAERARKNKWKREAPIKIVENNLSQFRVEFQIKIRNFFDILKSLENFSNKSIFKRAESLGLEFNDAQIGRFLTYLGSVGAIKTISKPSAPRVLKILKESIE